MKTLFRGCVANRTINRESEVAQRARCWSCRRAATPRAQVFGCWFQRASRCGVPSSPRETPPAPVPCPLAGHTVRGGAMLVRLMAGVDGCGALGSLDSLGLLYRQPETCRAQTPAATSPPLEGRDRECALDFGGATPVYTH